MKMFRGFTLIELMVVVAILGIIATVAVPAGCQMVGGESPNAGFTGKPITQLASETTLAKFPSSMMMVVTNTNCDKWDSDGNGRVRCTVSYMAEGNRDPEKIYTDNWDCPAAFSINTACVPLKAEFNVSQY